MTEHVTARISDDVAKRLNEPERNKSKTIEAALEQYFDANGEEKAMVQLRLEQVEDDITMLKSQLETKRETRNHLQGLLDGIEQDQEEQRENTLEKAITQFNVVDLKSVDGLMVDASDDDLEPYAEELDISIDDLRQRIIHGSEPDV